MSKAIIIVSFGIEDLEGLKAIEDFEAEVLSRLNNEKDNIVLIRYGSKTVNNNIYNSLKRNLKEKGYKNIYIGTLDGDVKKEDILRSLVKDVTIIPILMLPGTFIKKGIFGNGDSCK